ncbi:acid ceramidase-like protein [Tieghemostelium lacteum]|uniref:Acid ceramidase-like protein n=1 Tax=Tieghemostelium lacteum TaxID=361077 RepID=A0A151ZBN7_TIELA|nr:acid ceramidase-like protein [Tieghemostelium lacteum]|eukprot:KYQ91363.1 acid ceramidase-like protein [Tieghemostelium lacteum]
MFRNKIILFVVSFALICGQVYSQCSGGLPQYPVFNEQATLLNTTSNGKLYVVGPSNNTVNVVQLYGTPYEMGYAQGTLLKSQVNEIYDNFFNYITVMVNELIEKYADYLPLELVDVIEKFGVKAALDLTADATKKYTPSRFFEEMQGLADGAGLEYKTVLQVHMFPELIKAACSMVGAYNSATVNGGLLQLRALDFGLDPWNPLRLHPIVSVYHPTEGGHTFSVLTWAGFIGSLSGYSGHMGICEKYWFHYNGTASREGFPWHFLLRDILQYDSSINEALNRIYNNERTCSIFVGLGSNSTNTFEAVEYSHQVVRVFDDQTPFPAYEPQPPAHPNIQDVVYIDKYTQPSNNPCLASVLQKNLGQIDIQTLIDVTSLLETGDLHIGIYDFTYNQMYVSVASQDNWPPPANYSPTPAYARQFIQVDLEYFFNESQ